MITRIEKNRFFHYVFMMHPQFAYWSRMKTIVWRKK